MNSQTFELFFTFFDFFTSHAFDSKSRYIRRLISFEEIRLIIFEDIFFEEIRLIIFEDIFFEEIRLIILSQHDDLREWRNEICV